MNLPIKFGSVLLILVMVLFSGCTGESVPSMVYGAEYSIYDGTSYQASGNGNGLLEAGETVRLDVVLYNEGPGKAFDVQGEIFIDSYSGELIDGEAEYGSIPAGYYDSLSGAQEHSLSGLHFTSGADNETSFLFSINEEFIGTTFDFKLEIVCSNGETKSFILSIPVEEAL